MNDKLVALGFPLELEFWAVSLCGGMKANEPKEKLFFLARTVSCKQTKTRFEPQFFFPDSICLGQHQDTEVWNNQFPF